MQRTRQEFEELERRDLAPFALKAAESRGRRHPESEDPHRTAFGRDRDRVVHSGAFRRLEYKTQVLVNGTGDNYRTRMTHTLEVAQLARAVGRALRLNEPLVEAIGLSHDLGHPPFGHSGEEELRELMVDHGGFEHNSQALRIVDLLENPYPGRMGLNLTYEMRSALLKHGTKSSGPTSADIEAEPQPWLEAQVADAADSLAYISHDLDDGLRFGVFSEADLGELELWRRARGEAKRRFPGAAGEELLRPTVHATLALPVADLIAASDARLQAVAPPTPLAARRTAERLIAFTPEMQEIQSEAKRYLFKRFYYADHVMAVRREARRQLRELFLFLHAHPHEMADWARARLARPLPGDSSWRVTCDYVAGMTDRFAQQEWERLVGQRSS
ncbi:MAG: deoxyguanosinetriphosphate triphosphohydrolase [Planctomycetes bacterium]|nr:deoxyguanosinetriphosphate triphosphohydrolase [Planctomycetota bacterium]